MLPKKKRERNICSVNNCRSYREANRWPEPLTFHEFPADLARRKLWLQIIEREDWIPGDKAKICAMHFAPECYREATASAVKRLNATAVPSLNLTLEPLPNKPTKTATLRIKNSSSGGTASSSTATQSHVDDVEHQPIISVDYGHEKAQYGMKDADTTTESRKRISNIIVVDLIKDKKAKYPDKPKPVVIGESCSSCLEMKKDLREVEFQLAMVKQELTEQKKLVESLKKQIKNGA